jgi:hypothetical protein
MNHISRTDAVVALRSFGRRYADVLTGPVGDDAWERQARKVGADGHSGAGFVAAAIGDLHSLVGLLIAVPVTAKPSVVAVSTTEPALSVALTQLQADVKSAAASAGDALDARQDEDFEKKIRVGNRETNVGAHINELITRLAADVRHAESAIEHAR